MDVRNLFNYTKGWIWSEIGSRSIEEGKRLVHVNGELESAHEQGSSRKYLSPGRIVGSNLCFTVTHGMRECEYVRMTLPLQFQQQG
ncbi:hypothetical protein MPTK1_7g00160 [Marchantia polymorpha subsp. ruderalis]|uniref:Uncharacterized protein n=2 Tax=Marchantia polymorpha TaxID=3197 RepID=A0AAF6BUM5_MARPO|nr:hypothetical protein MARPO_0046s0107 [Marchantia polymorpha]BBN15709.1 hypothetical protein Mp_7g00160 [Marchantia polymorpha subsp. ruderalis]|eukprot:PTQ39297.1 hypothetical protein MARPO_0046s0107 [Marchantia polymorpha]